MISWLKKVFKVEENHSTVKREIYAGTVTFLAISYILAVNPVILSSAGMDRGGGCVRRRWRVFSEHC